MRTFENYADLKAALDAEPDQPGAFRFLRDYAPTGFRCAGCGQVTPFHFDGGGTGYGLGELNAMYCYECCTHRDIAAMRGLFGPFYCYLNSDASAVTSWPGGTLGKVYSFNVSRSGWHGAEIARFHVKDVHGQWWQGRGAGKGMCCTLRPMKTPGYAKNWGIDHANKNHFRL